ncbi:MAG TPA: RDD family protein [Candidatus Nitrosopolaris sp.]|nr:RDD family protein [Candidatus Nitrosopolaris sp.]
MRRAEGRVWVEDSVANARPVSGKELRDRYTGDVRPLSLGLARMEGSSMRLGPLEILRFGRPKVTRAGVDWPIEGGLAAGGPGGSFAVRAADGRLVASLTGYRPRLPFALYVVTQLPIHHLVMRMYLLRVRGRLPEPGVPAPPTRRLAAAAIDVALCAAMALVARRRRLVAFAGIAAGYHVACWSVSGRTLGGAVTGTRIVAVDGSRPSIGQSIVRLLALPLAALRMRAAHDELAATEVVAD